MNSYDDEYRITEGLFWETSPAKYVRLFADGNYLNLEGKSVLDIGAGEGKNTLYMAKLGCYVDAIDISMTALRKLQFLNDFESYKNQINLINADVLTFNSNKKYDLVISYGLLHALGTRINVQNVITALKSCVKVNGYIIIASFNNLVPPPSIQPYLKIDAFLNPFELKTIFTDWEIINYEEEIITETHHTSNVEHQHSISRLIAKKNV